MNTIIKISWRNVWRNRARSIVIILAIAFGLWGGITATGFMTGMIQQMFKSTVKSQVSHVQIHHPKFSQERLTTLNIPNPEAVFGAVDKVPNLIAYTGRTIAGGMVNTASMSSAVDIIGIDPEAENRTTGLGDHVKEGEYFGEGMEQSVLMGAKLAKKLNMIAGDRIVLTFQNLTGDITSAAFRISGIYQTANSMNDERNLYVRHTDMDQLMGDTPVINEIAVLLTDHLLADQVRDQLVKQFPDLEIRSWSQVAPELAYMTQMSGMALMVLVIIILMAMAFGLLNTMLMTIFERTRELGVLMAVGMNKGRVFLMILLETTFLVITGSVVGAILGGTTINLTGRAGVDLTSVGGDTLSDFGMEAIIYPALESHFYLNLSILVLITALGAAVYPALKAIRLKPADAVRKE
jgi:ABC-type lipoprotein release transport system permease subunit